MCPAATLARAALLLCLVVGSRQLSITELSVPSSVRAGESVELACRVDRGSAPEDSLVVKWWWIPFNGTKDKVQIYQRTAPEQGTRLHHVHIQVKDGDSIVLLEAKPEDTGAYECDVSSMSGDIEEARKQQDLVVYSPGSGPELNISSVADGPDEDTDEDVLIECRAEQVAPEPSLLLKINGVEYINITEEITDQKNGYYDALSTATLTKADVDGATVTCELTYNDTRITHEPYVAMEDYHSGTTTAAPQESTLVPDTASDSLQNQNGDTTANHASWALLLALGLLTQVPSLFRVFNVILM